MLSKVSKIANKVVMNRNKARLITNNNNYNTPNKIKHYLTKVLMKIQ